MRISEFVHISRGVLQDEPIIIEVDRPPPEQGSDEVVEPVCSTTETLGPQSLGEHILDVVWRATVLHRRAHFPDENSSDCVQSKDANPIYDRLPRQRRSGCSTRHEVMQLGWLTLAKMVSRPSALKTTTCASMLSSGAYHATADEAPHLSVLALVIKPAQALRAERANDLRRCPDPTVATRQ